MSLLITSIKIFIIEYFILLLHELIHYITSLILGFKASTFYLIPFNFNKNNSANKFKVLLFKDPFTTSILHFNSINISSKLQYNILLKKMKVFFWIGPIFDFTIFVVLFSIGVSKVNFSYLALISLIHFCISTINFFNSDGKYAIGCNEDNRIAFDLIRSCTLCGNNKVSYETKRILTDYHMEISDNISINAFNVNDLWNFLNNIYFYTNSILSYLNKDILLLHPSTDVFFHRIIQDYNDIKVYDYRQVEKTAIAILYYSIYKKISDENYVPKKDILKTVYNDLKSPYYKKLYELYFQNKASNKDYLYYENNMPSSFSYCEGYKKLLINILDLL